MIVHRPPADGGSTPGKAGALKRQSWPGRQHLASESLPVQHGCRRGPPQRPEDDRGSPWRTGKRVAGDVVGRRAEQPRCSEGQGGARRRSGPAACRRAARSAGVERAAAAVARQPLPSSGNQRGGGAVAGRIAGDAVVRRAEQPRRFVGQGGARRRSGPAARAAGSWAGSTAHSPLSLAAPGLLRSPSDGVPRHSAGGGVHLPADFRASRTGSRGTAATPTSSTLVPPRPAQLGGGRFGLRRRPRCGG